jgi:Xaa-Pro aminopeptidase
VAHTIGITRQEYIERQHRVRAAARERGWRAVVAIGRAFYDRPGNLAYLSGHFPPFPASTFAGKMRGIGHSLVVLPVEGEPTLLVDGEYREDLVAVGHVEQGGNLVAALIGSLQREGLATERLGLAGDDILPLTFYRELLSACPGLQLESADGILAAMRRRKSPAEQALLRQAAEVAVVGLRTALEAIAPGKTEAKVSAAGTAAALEAGADFVRYLRVHTGARSAHGARWPPATGTKIEAGDVVWMDIIGACEGYQFDVLRTTVAGKASPEANALLEAVHHSVETVVSEVRPGMTAGELSRRSKELLGASGFGETASRFVGHGIGLETVEEPYLVPDETTRLEADMVLCIEPRATIPGKAGACIEQEVIVRDGPAEVITAFPTRLWPMR